VPFTSVHAGKYRTEKKQMLQRTKDNPEKANNTKHSKTKLACSVASYNTRAEASIDARRNY